MWLCQLSRARPDVRRPCGRGAGQGFGNSRPPILGSVRGERLCRRCQVPRHAVRLPSARRSQPSQLGLRLPHTQPLYPPSVCLLAHEGLEKRGRYQHAGSSRTASRRTRGSGAQKAYAAAWHERCFARVQDPAQHHQATSSCKVFELSSSALGAWNPVRGAALPHLTCSGCRCREAAD